MIDWAAFTPWSALVGGALIGLSVVLLLWGNGKVLGVSGILGRAVFEVRTSSWQLAFLLGMAITPTLYLRLGGQLPAVPKLSWLAVVAAGLLVGLGTQWGSGCTSGHGVCGLSRLSRRSFVATLVFMAAAMLTVYVQRHLMV